MSLLLNIDDLIHQRKVESARIEYKKDRNPEKVLLSVCAFANDIDNWGGGYNVLAGEMPGRQLRNAQTFIDLRTEELMLNWKLCMEGKDVVWIDPIR
jgi:hypothetical protein